MDMAYWENIVAIKQAVNKAIELQRNEGKVKGGLTTEVSLYADDGVKALVEGLGEELKFVLMTSVVHIKPYSDAPADAMDAADVDGLKVGVEPSSNNKCVRCWFQTDDVGSHEGHEELCGRCVSNVDGDGEVRAYA